MHAICSSDSNDGLCGVFELSRNVCVITFQAAQCLAADPFCREDLAWNQNCPKSIFWIDCNPCPISSTTDSQSMEKDGMTSEASTSTSSTVQNSTTVRSISSTQARIETMQEPIGGADNDPDFHVAMLIGCVTVAILLTLLILIIVYRRHISLRLWQYGLFQRDQTPRVSPRADGLSKAPDDVTLQDLQLAVRGMSSLQLSKLTTRANDSESPGTAGFEVAAERRLSQHQFIPLSSLAASEASRDLHDNLATGKSGGEPRFDPFAWKTRTVRVKAARGGSLA